MSVQGFSLSALETRNHRGRVPIASSYLRSILRSNPTPTACCCIVRPKHSFTRPTPLSLPSCKPRVNLVSKFGFPLFFCCPGQKYGGFCSKSSVVQLHGTNLLLSFQFVDRYGKDPQITKMLRAYDWYLLPIHNPDGYEYSRNHVRMSSTRMYPKLLRISMVTVFVCDQSALAFD